jgi:hypothetical protein
VQLEAWQLGQEAQRSARAANVLYAVGAAALATATVLLVRDL